MKKLLSLIRNNISSSILQLYIMKHLQFSTNLLAFCLLLYLVTSPSVSPDSTSPLSTIAYSGGSNRFAKITMTYSSSLDVGSVLLLVKPSPGLTTAENSLSTYKHKNPVQYTYFDLQHANTGATQVVQLDLGSSSTTLYIIVRNFQSKTVSYSISSSQSATSNSSLCINGIASTTSLYCTSCSSSIYIGAYCNILYGSISSSTTYAVTLSQYGSNNYLSLSIPSTDKKLTFHYKSTITSVTSFIQFQQRTGQYAGWMNYVTNGGKNTITKANTQYNVNINSNGQIVLIAFWNSNNANAVITFWYQEDSGANILLIILGVLGGVLFILLLIVAIYIVKRMNSNQMRQVQPDSPLRRGRSRNQNPENILTQQQIQTYFPAVLYNNVFQQEQNSSFNLTQLKNQAQNSGQCECSICLCPVEKTEMIRVTFCRHIFHAHCLTEWFKKNRNCPYCREEYSKKSTMDHYQNLLKLTHKNMLMGVDLVSNILKSRQGKSSIIVQQIKQ